MKSKYFLLALFLVVLFSVFVNSTTYPDQQIFFNNVSNLTLRLEQETVADSIINVSGINNLQLEINNVTTNGARFTNINETFGGEVVFNNLTINYSIKSITNNQYLFTATSSSRNQFNYTLSPNEEIQVQDYSCTVPYEDMVITEDTTFCSGTYYLNGSATGAIKFGVSNIGLNCNNANFQGNWTSGSGRYALHTNGMSNLTIKNCKFIGGYRIDVIISSAGENITLKDSYFNSTAQSIALQSDNSFIYNNTFENVLNSVSGTAIIGESGANNNQIYGNNITTSLYGIRIWGNDTWIYNNQVNNITWWGIGTENISMYNRIEFNNITNSNWDGLQIRGQINNFTDNYIFNSEHHALDLFVPDGNIMGNGNFVERNVINKTLGLNIPNPYSHYIYLYRTNSNIIRDNIFYGGSGVRGSGISIQSNGSANEYSSNNIFSNNSFDNVTIWALDISDGVNNTFNSNVFSNVSQDFFRALFNTQNSSFSENIFKGVVFNFDSFGYFQGLVNITSDYQWVLNNNDTETYQLNLYNKTNALIYNTNGSIYGNSDISLNDGNINITLTPNNASYVLDKYTKAEGETIRENDPITISGNTTTKYLTSTLFDSITMPVSMNVQKCDIDYIYQTSGGTLSPSDWTCDTSLNILTLDLNIPSGSKTLTIDYSETQTGGGTNVGESTSVYTVPSNETSPQVQPENQNLETTTTPSEGINAKWIILIIVAVIIVEIIVILVLSKVS